MDGVLDITGMDLSQTVVNVNNSWDFYPNALYTSADFASGGADRLPEGEGETRYGTYRLIIKAQPERYYTLCSYSIDYSTRVFVNGVEAAGFGTVADNAAESVPPDRLYDHPPLLRRGQGRSRSSTSFPTSSTVTGASSSPPTCPPPRTWRSSRRATT